MGACTMAKPQFSIQPDELDRIFFQSYDSGFLAAKARGLMRLIENWDEYLASENSSGSGMEPITAKHRHALAAELLFTEMHQFESLWALIIACLEETPHWLFLSSYQQEDINGSLRAYLGSRPWGKLSSGGRDEWRRLIEFAVYSGSRPQDPDVSARWQINIDNLDWIFRRTARRYDEPALRNGYKHGLRFFTGQTTLSMWAEDNPSNKLLINSGDSITHLEVRTDPDGRRTLWETTRHFSYTESFILVVYMARIAEAIRATRYARHSGEHPELNTFFGLDKDAVRQESSWSTFSIQL